MRIRSFKPEFWRSRDIIDIGLWEHRLLFLGLWSYVDDNGVGRDEERLIVADLFALEEDPRETLATISGGLQKLADLGRITRYTVDGRPFLHITNWTKHQRIDKPAKERYPLPTCENAVIRGTLAAVSREPLEAVAPGAVEQGSSGTGEQVRPRAARKQHVPADWAPNGRHADKARRLELDLEEEVENFRNWDLAKGPVWKDFDAAFNLWLGNAAKWGKSSRNPYSRQQETDGLFDRAMRRTQQQPELESS